MTTEEEARAEVLSLEGALSFESLPAVLEESERLLRARRPSR